MAQPKVTMFMPAGEPKPADYEISVFYMTRPEVALEEMAVIEVGDTNDDSCMNKILEKAREIGSDGVIILGRVGSYEVLMSSSTGNKTSTTGSGLGVSSGYGLSALAIRFRD